MLIERQTMKTSNKSEATPAKRIYEKPELTEIVLEDYTEGKKSVGIEAGTLVGAS